MPEPDLALLVDAARAAGEVAQRFWRRDPQVWDKGAEGPVTEADLAVNRLLEDRLRAARPDYGWLSEESPDDGGWLSARRSFVVDPIDGTRAFIAGEPQFAHALAVVEAGRAVAGVVFLPALDRLYAADAGGATCNGAPIAAAEGAGVPQVLASAAALAPAQWPGGVPPLRRSQRASLAYRLCLVADGSFDAMLTLRDTWAWDAAAGALIAAAAGAAVSDRDGAPLRLDRLRLPGLIVAAPALHARLAASRRAAG